MLKHFFTFLLCMAFAHAFAQDTIMMRNGDQVLAKIKVVGLSEIEYYRADNITGPLHVVAKADVFMIKFQNGTREVFSNAETPTVSAPSRTPAPRSRERRETYQGYEELHQKGARRIVAGSVITALGGGMLITGITLSALTMQSVMRTSSSFNGTPETLVGGAFLTIASIPCLIIGPIQLAKGFRYRRQAQEMRPSLSLSPIINNSNLARYNYAPRQTTVAAIGITF